MNAREFETQLVDALYVATDDDEFPMVALSTFEDRGLMTRDKGVVIRFEDGAEFQLTIVQSEWAADDEDDDG